MPGTDPESFFLALSQMILRLVLYFLLGPIYCSGIPKEGVLMEVGYVLGEVL